MDLVTLHCMPINAKMHHAGLWVQPQDCNALQTLLKELLGFELVSRVPRKRGGERLFLKNSSGQYLEILVADNVVRLSEYPRHPKDRVAGVAHLCFTVADTEFAASRAEQLGAQIVLRAPAEGEFTTSELGEHRMVFVQAPGEITLELFQFKDQVEL